MNKKELIADIVILATALKIEVVTKDLDVEALSKLHDELTVEKTAMDKALANEQSKESKSKQEKVVLEFTSPYKRYANKDIAGFDAEIADRILALKPSVAVKYKEKSDEE